jgi:hypothetical protein
MIQHSLYLISSLLPSRVIFEGEGMFREFIAYNPKPKRNLSNIFAVDKRPGFETQGTT